MRVSPFGARVAALTCAVGSALTCSSAAYAQAFNEAEDNNSKAAANAIVFTNDTNGVVGTITGNATGSSTTATGSTSIDVYRVTLPPAAVPGIYQYRLVLTTAGTAGHTATIRGLDQVTGGFIRSGTDQVLQTSSTSTVPPRYIQLFAPGNALGGPDFYCRITGTSTTLSNYVATLERTAIAPAPVAGSFVAGNITVTTLGQGHATDTEFVVLDSAFNPVSSFRNDDEGPGGATTQSNCVRALTPGTYYLAISDVSVMTSDGNPFDDDDRVDDVLDFPGAVIASNAAGGSTINFAISDGSTTTQVLASKPSAFTVNWYSFTVVASPSQNTAYGEALPYNAISNTSHNLRVTTEPNMGNAVTGVTVDLSIFGLSSTSAMSMATANTWTLNYNIPVTAFGDYALPFTVTRADMSTFNGTIHVNVFPATPSNDLCSGAITVTVPSTITFSNFSATNDIDVGACNTSTTEGGFGVWFAYTPAASGVLNILNTQTNQDVAVGLFDPADNMDPCNTLGASIQCADATSLTDPAQFTVIAGTLYYLLVVNDASTTTPDPDSPTLEFSFFPAPANDLCSGAIDLDAQSLPFSLSYENVSATADNNLSCTTTNVPFGTWFKWTAPMTGVFVLNESSSGDQDWAIFTASDPMNPCASLSNVACIETDITSFAGAAGTTYYILSGNHSTSTTLPTTNPAFTFSLGLPPSNDNCSGAIEVTGVPFSSQVSAAFATDDAIVPSCRTVASTFNGVWYKFTPGSTASYSISEGTSINALLTLYTASDPMDPCNTLTEFACTDADASLFNLAAGTTYYILLSRNSTTVPGVPANWSFNVLPPQEPLTNDFCVDAIQVTTSPFYHYTDNNLATMDGPTDDDCDVFAPDPTAENSIWYKFTPFGSGNISVVVNGDVGDNAFDSIAYIYSPVDPMNPCSGHNILACADDPDPSTISNFPLTGGNTYFILAADNGSSELGGDVFVTITYTGQISAPTGACCNGSSCTTVTQASCISGGGAYQGDNSSCVPSPCAPPTGSCCAASGACTITDQASCTGVWTLAGSCTPNTCPCPGDFDGNRTVEVSDIFSFLNAWFAQFNVCVSNCSADIDANNAVEVADIFAFLNKWFSQFGTPCP